MHIDINDLETEDEVRGKAFVYWTCWHTVYPGMVSQDWLDGLTLEKCERKAFGSSENVLVAKDGERVVGFIGFGDRGEEAPGVGEVFTMYILPGYWRRGIGSRLMKTALDRLRDKPSVCLWVLKENHGAIRFYEKCGFVPDGQEKLSSSTGAWGIRMVLGRESDRRSLQADFSVQKPSQ